MRAKPKTAGAWLTAKAKTATPADWLVLMAAAMFVPAAVNDWAGKPGTGMWWFNLATAIAADAVALAAAITQMRRNRAQGKDRP
jgi:hypothetical protein